MITDVKSIKVMLLTMTADNLIQPAPATEATTSIVETEAATTPPPQRLSNIREASQDYSQSTSPHMNVNTVGQTNVEAAWLRCLFGDNPPPVATCDSASDADRCYQTETFQIQIPNDTDPLPVYPTLQPDPPIESNTATLQVTLRLEVRAESDTYLTRLTLSLPSNQTQETLSEVWPRLAEALASRLQTAASLGCPIPWGVSYLYYGEVDDKIDSDGYQRFFREANITADEQAAEQGVSTSYGRIWLFERQVVDEQGEALTPPPPVEPEARPSSNGEAAEPSERTLWQLARQDGLNWWRWLHSRLRPPRPNTTLPGFTFDSLTALRETAQTLGSTVSSPFRGADTAADEAADDQATVWQTKHRLALLTKKRYTLVTEEDFLWPFRQGWTRIEYYHHKARYHQWRYEAEVGKPYRAANRELREVVREALRTQETDHIQQERQELERMGNALAKLLSEQDAAQHLQQSLEANITSLEINLRRVQWQPRPYQQMMQELQTTVDLIKHDSDYALITQRNAEAIMTANRETVAMRLEYAGLLLGIAAAILTLISVFDGFLESWEFLIKESSLAMPAPWIRLATATLVTVSSGLLIFGLGLPISLYKSIVRERWGVVILAAAFFLVGVFWAWRASYP